MEGRFYQVEKRFQKAKINIDDQFEAVQEQMVTMEEKMSKGFAEIFG